MSKSVENLKTAFAGESMANRRYLAFAKKADQEGFPQIAKLFRAAAAAETVHATNHFRAMDGIKGYCGEPGSCHRRRELRSGLDVPDHAGRGG